METPAHNSRIQWHEHALPERDHARLDCFRSFPTKSGRIGYGADVASQQGTDHEWSRKRGKGQIVNLEFRAEGSVPSQSPITGSDKGSDKGRDRGSDRGSDKGSDKGSDRGSDRGSDKGSDKGRDRGSDRGSVPCQSPITDHRSPITVSHTSLNIPLLSGV
jgi:hypothetical protein